jgi:DNA-binding phage protein
MRKKGLSRYRVSKDLGIAQESLFWLLTDGANPRWEMIKKVLDYLGYEIRLVEQKRRGS